MYTLPYANRPNIINITTTTRIVAPSGRTMSGRAQQNRGNCLCQFLPNFHRLSSCIATKTILYWFLAIPPPAMAFETNGGAALTGRYMFSKLLFSRPTACLSMDMSVMDLSGIVCIYSNYICSSTHVRFVDLTKLDKEGTYMIVYAYFSAYFEVFFLV